jgi:4,5-DOPA dioxygenase extradiol
MPETMPAIFFGHGNPMNALLKNAYTEAWAKIGRRLPRPTAILCVSAHWYIPEAAVTATAQPRTIHDFGGFPRELYEVKYPAPGSPELARRIQELLAPVTVRSDERWGLDHGTWSVLCNVFPEADIPVVQLSLDEIQPAGFHYELAKKLQPLREVGVLICGSGNIVHNLHAYSWGKKAVEPYDWALRFEATAREMILNGNHTPLINYEGLGRDALLSAPTPEHYLPLLYILGLQQADEKISFPVEGFDGGSISMLTVQIG